MIPLAWLLRIFASVARSKSKVLTISLKTDVESYHSVFSFKDLDIKSTIVLCLQKIWTGDTQMFSLKQKTQFCFEKSLYFSETIPPMLLTYAIAVVLSDLI